MPHPSTDTRSITRRDLLTTGALLSAAACLGAGPPSASTVGVPLCRLARPSHRPVGAPRAGDVILRCLTPQTDDHNPHSTMKALETFHATRLEWAYAADPAFIARVTASGRVFGGTIAATTYDRSVKDNAVFDAVNVKGVDGKPLSAPWKRRMGRLLWGCVNNPEFERGYVSAAKKVVALGVNVVQRDEPEANAGSVRWGGCYCDHCIAAFRTYLASHTTPADRKGLGIGELDRFDFRAYARAHPATRKSRGSDLHHLFLDFQSDATTAFHQRTRRAINAAAGGEMPMSCNNGRGLWKPYHRCFDWGFGELPARVTSAHAIVEAMRDARAVERVQVFTMPLPGADLAHDHAAVERLTRRAIATACAAGGWIMVPWDVYLPQNQPRYFGKPEQYADLYGFIRAAAPHLETYEEAFATGAGVAPASPVNPAPLQIAAGAGSVLALARAKPDQPAAPAVVHLVDWSDSPRSTTLHLRHDSFGTNPRITLLTPTPYDATAHHDAERRAQSLRVPEMRPSPAAQSSAFAALLRKASLTATADGDHTTVTVPPLSPWGILLIQST